MNDSKCTLNISDDINTSITYNDRCSLLECGAMCWYKVTSVSKEHTASISTGSRLLWNNANLQTMQLTHQITVFIQQNLNFTYRTEVHNQLTEQSEVYKIIIKIMNQTVFIPKQQCVLTECHRHIIIIIIHLSWSSATCWPLPISLIQKSLHWSAMFPSASWGIAFHYPG
jgi:hypothetical protein